MCLGWNQASNISRECIPKQFTGFSPLQERLFINLLPLAGLVPRKTVLEDRWALRAADPDWPRSSAEVKATTGCKAVASRCCWFFGCSCSCIPWPATSQLND